LLYGRLSLGQEQTSIRDLRLEQDLGPTLAIKARNGSVHIHGGMKLIQPDSVDAADALGPTLGPAARRRMNVPR
jgi:hypothetical protein